MGKKRITTFGDTDQEEKAKKQKEIEREQKKLREGKDVKKSEAKSYTTGATETPITSPATKSKTKVQRKRSKNYLSSKVKIDPTVRYTLTDGISLLRSMPQPKFSQTLELHINCLTKLSNQTVTLPHSTGHTKVAAIATDETIAEIEAGNINFDILFATPQAMPKLAKLAKTLGPRGLMPNPKTGTVTEDPQKAVKEFASQNRITLKSEPKAAVIHTVAGKLSQKDAEIIANISTILDSIKTRNIKSLFIKTTMSPSLKLHLEPQE